MHLPRLTTIAVASIVLLAMPAVSQAQRAQVVGVTRAEAPTSMRHALRVESPVVVGIDTTQATASEAPRWLGATIGAVIGGLAGYRWELGVCDSPASECTGRHGAVGGGVIGGVLGYLLGGVFQR